MYTIEDIIVDISEVHKLIEELLLSTDRRIEVKGQHGLHYKYVITEDEKDLLLRCYEPLGIDEAKRLITDYYKYFREYKDSSEIEEFAEVIALLVLKQDELDR
jgi:hypothetical protein